MCVLICTDLCIYTFFILQGASASEVAVRGGLCLTGPTITSAGLIMAIAFCGLLLRDLGCHYCRGLNVITKIVVPYCCYIYM